MRIAIINIDSERIENLALAKIKKYHELYKNIIVEDINKADIIYVSCVFEINKDKCEQFEDINKCFIGGSGYSLNIKLPKEIENIKPHINLGFTTRGCIRKCPWCIVPKKEGKIKVVGDLLDLWNGNSKDIILLDNNILALPEHFKLVCKQARKYNLKLDFNQGLDCRLLNQEIIDELKITRTFDLHFAFDDLSYFDSVDKAITLLQKNGINRCNWLLLTGFNTTLIEDLFRANYLRSRNQVGYIMRYNNSKRKDLIPLSRWVNNRAWFRAITWDEFIEKNYKGREVEYGIEDIT